MKIKVRQYADDRWGFDDHTQGERRKVRCTTKAQAERRALDLTVVLTNRDKDNIVDRTELHEFRKWKEARNRSVPVTQAKSEFLALKKGESSRYTESLAGDLELFENFVGADELLSTVSALDIQRFLSSRDVSDRRKFNLRAAVVSLFKWARRMSYLPATTDGMTEAEKVQPIKKGAGTPNVLLPDQMRKLLANVREEYLPWLCVGAFAGVRTQEIAPDRHSKKSALMWSDFDWSSMVIIVRKETSKVNKAREVPISENLAELLAPYRGAIGPICQYQPTNTETRRLGKLIGGWKHNCLRDSFCSYRTRITQSIHQTSLEMGNSPAMVSRSYHERQPIQQAREWFDIRPRKDSNVIAFSEAVA